MAPRISITMAPGRMNLQLCSALPKSEINTAALRISLISCAKFSSVRRACISSSAGHAWRRCSRTLLTTSISLWTFRLLEARSELAHRTRFELSSWAPTFSHAMRRTVSAAVLLKPVVCPRGSFTLSSASLTTATPPALTLPRLVSGPSCWLSRPCSRLASSSTLAEALRSVKAMAAAGGTTAGPLVAQQPRLSRERRPPFPWQTGTQFARWTMSRAAGPEKIVCSSS
mmetsp:Transcript_65067/g.128671  ORF Transcript_65067/g.128671 Transcript_65067/m.128671 type:complete len:228 (-) Transcript_65067:354-1037(-)